MRSVSDVCSRQNANAILVFPARVSPRQTSGHPACRLRESGCHAKVAAGDDHLDFAAKICRRSCLRRSEFGWGSATPEWIAQFSVDDRLLSHRRRSQTDREEDYASKLC